LLLYAATSNAACLKYPRATLTGTIFKRTDFGPPNYGEDPKTDSREEHLYLKLDRPVCVDAARPNDDLNVAETNITKMQMVYFPRERFQSVWIGRRVTVTGALFHSFSAHHWTPVLIEPEETRVLGS